MEVWAKSDPLYSLRDHLTDVRNAAQRLLTPARRAVFRRLGIGEQQADALLSAAAWLHDFGKATGEWQNDLVAGRRPPQHSLTSFIACLWAHGITKVQNMPPDRLAVALAILGHHGQLSKDSFQRDTFHGQQVHILGEVWEYLARDLPFAAPGDRLPTAVATERLCNQVDAAKRLCPDLALQQPFRGLYCLLLSLLVEADHAASGGRVPVPESLGMPRVPGTPTRFQEEVRRRPADVLCAIAGCGSGKTAAALLRAAELAEQSHADRIVICLPTRFTSNSLLRDMSDPEKYSYPESQVGLIHAEALSVLRSLPGREREDEQDFPETREEQAFRRIGVRYEHPVTISTVDHLLMSLYHGYRFSDRAFGNLLSSVVVFDEVHAYDTITLNAIREGLTVLQQHSVPTLFMSATLPTTRRRFFGLKDQDTVIEQDNPYRPFHLHQVVAPLTTGRGIETEASETARTLLRDGRGLKLAVYVNQVERAKALARAAREVMTETPIYCYHSELAQIDRVEMEGKIIAAFRQESPVVLIATQAAELSLDISAERMITEQAPADVLVQRAGRLHRRGRSPMQEEAAGRLPAGFAFLLLVAPVDLTEEREGFVPGALPYEDVALLKRTWQCAPWGEAFDFVRGLHWCEESLTDEPPQRGNGLVTASVNDAVFGNKPQENFGDEGDEGLVTIRARDEEVVPVVPEIYFGRLGDTLDQLTRFFVPLRRRKYQALEKAGFIDDRYISLVLAKGKRNREKTISYKVRVVRSNLPYEPSYVGFDFRIHEGEMAAQVLYDSFL